METKRIQIPVELKTEDGDGTISGYGSVFGVRDAGGDVVVEGAFSDTLKERMPKMFFGHDPDAIAGVWDEAREDQRGLFVKGRLNLDTQLGRETHSNLKMGALSGLSIGYRVKDREFDGEVRKIKSAELFEVSIVSMPMNEEAQIDAVKALDEGDTSTMKRIIETAAREAGCSLREAKAVATAGAARLVSLRDVGAGAEAVELARKTLLA